MSENSTRFEIKGVEYAAGKLDARKQFHIVRRMAPILGAIAPALEAQNEAAGIKAFCEAAGSMSDSELDYVIDHCLAVVEKHDGATWAKVMILDGDKGVLMYKDMTLIEMFAMIFNVVKANLSGFFGELPPEFSEVLKKAMPTLNS